MLLTQTIAELHASNVRPVGVYFDEVELSEQSYGKSRQEHIAELQRRSGNRMIVACKFEFRPSKYAHSEYNRIVASVLGDEVK